MLAVADTAQPICFLCMFHSYNSAVQGVVEGGNIERPLWLGLAVHVLNTVFAWIDVLIAQPRAFSKRAEAGSVGFAFVYLLWILLCRHFNGAFPYPFMNRMPQPWGFLAVGALGVFVFYSVFHLGRFVKTLERSMLTLVHGKPRID